MKRGHPQVGWHSPGRGVRDERVQLCQHPLLAWALTWVIPIPQQPDCSQQLPVPQEMKDLPRGRFGNGWDTAESCCWCILPSSAAGIPRTCICIVTPSNK